MKLHKLLLTVIAGSFLFVSCSDDDSNPAVPASGEYANGVLILNQGNFGAGNSEVSFLSNDMQMEHNIFSGVNPDLELGDTGQSIGFYGDLAYIVMNFSEKIEVVNRYTFQHVATISEGFINPRYIAFSGNKAFVSNWGDGGSATDDYIAVLDLTTNTVTATIPVVEGPEKIVEQNGKIYVAHAGGYGYGSTVTVINANTNAVDTSINVGTVPNSLEIANGKLYVLSGGMPSWGGTETDGELHVISLANNTIDYSVDFSEHGPSNLDIENGSIYYTVDSRVYKMDIAATTLPATPLFTTADQGEYGVYSLAVRNGYIYLGDAVDYISSGKVYVHDISGQMVQSYTVGVMPAGFYFN